MVLFSGGPNLGTSQHNLHDLQLLRDWLDLTNICVLTSFMGVSVPVFWYLRKYRRCFQAKHCICAVLTGIMDLLTWSTERHQSNSDPINARKAGAEELV